MDQKMIYVALLRGINVGGNNKIEMKKLALGFQRLGFSDVRTYINSGNVVFASEQTDPAQLSHRIEQLIREDFGLDIRVVLRDFDQMGAICQALPDTWVKNKVMRTDVMFLWESLDSSDMLRQLDLKPTDAVTSVPGALLWHIQEKDYHQSGMATLAKNAAYKQMTVRNVNTVRRIFEIMQEVHR